MATEQEIHQLLIQASGIDNRLVVPGGAAHMAWFEVLAPFDIRELRAALVQHRRTSTEYVVPAHLTTILAAARKSANLTPQLEAMCPAHAGYPLRAGEQRCFFGQRHSIDCRTAEPYELLTQQQAIAAGLITEELLPNPSGQSS